MGRRIRVQNFSMGEIEEWRPPDDRVFYSVIIAAVFGLFIITYPYREVYIPSWVLALVGLFFMGALMVLSWVRPQYYWASIAFCVYIPFSGEYPGDFNNLLLAVNMTNLLLVPLFLQWIMQRGQLNEPLFRYHAPDIWVLAFALLSSFSVFRVGIEGDGGSFAAEFIRLKRWITPFLIYFLFVNMSRNEQGVRYLIVTICAALTAIAILTMKESYDIGPAGTWDRIRVKGVLGQSNATGAFFVYYPLMFLCFWLSYWRDRRSWLLLIPFLMCGRAMTLANSRGGMVAFTIATLVTLWFHSKRLFLVGLAIVILGINFPQYLPETISGRLIYGTFRPLPGTEAHQDFGSNVPGSGPNLTDMRHQLDQSSQGRLAIWTAGWKLYKERIWFGHGYGAFPRTVGKYNPQVAWRDPHNTYLGVAVEMGGIALFTFLMILLYMLRASLHVYHHGRDRFMRSVGLAGVGMIMGVACANFFGSRLDTSELTAYFWIISALIVQYDTELRAQMQAVARPADRLVVDPWANRDAEEPAHAGMG